MNLRAIETAHRKKKPHGISEKRENEHRCAWISFTKQFNIIISSHQRKFIFLCYDWYSALLTYDFDERTNPTSRHFIVANFHNIQSGAIRWAPLSAIIWHTLFKTVNQWLLLQTLQTRWTYIPETRRKKKAQAPISSAIVLKWGSKQSNEKRWKKKDCWRRWRMLMFGWI